MNIGEIISALALCASKWDNDGGDHLLMLRSVSGIEVDDDYVNVYFVDGNTPDIKVYKDGKCENRWTD